MTTLVIIPCGSAKIWDKFPGAGPTPAKDAYTGGPFRMNRRYAERFGDTWIILSAKYGFIEPDYPIPGPYNVTFRRRRTNPVDIATLRPQVADQHLGRFSTVIGLGGVEYRRMIKAAFEGTRSSLEFPFAGLGLGECMQAAKRLLDSP